MTAARSLRSFGSLFVLKSGSGILPLDENRKIWYNTYIDAKFDFRGVKNV